MLPALPDISFEAFTKEIRTRINPTSILLKDESIKQQRASFRKHVEDEKYLDKIKITIASNQKFKCWNKPNSNLSGLDNYNCKLWQDSDGTFDELGYVVDYIEIVEGVSNLQALCQSCYKVKKMKISLN